MDLYIEAMPVGTYRVQSPGFPKIVYYRLATRTTRINLYSVHSSSFNNMSNPYLTKNNKCPKPLINMKVVRV